MAPMIARCLVLGITIAALLSSCTTDDLRQAAIIGGGSAGGAAIGNSLGKGQKNQGLYAAGGGAVGAAVGAIVAGPNKGYGDKRYQEGYDQASSNDVEIPLLDEAKPREGEASIRADARPITRCPLKT